jgi:hypothetical protein
MKIYHGTNCDFTDIDLSHCKDKRDFGKGFYTTILEEQARQWAEFKCRQYNTDTAYLYEYEINDYSGLNVKRFDAYTLDWLEFIKENRMKGSIQHNFDIVIGPVADDKVARTLKLYLKGTNNAEWTLRKLMYSKPNNQVSLHTIVALKKLTLCGRTEWKTTNP